MSAKTKVLSGLLISHICHINYCVFERKINRMNCRER